jgi:predicted nucleotidyltransferase
MDLSHPISTAIPSLDGPVLAVLAGTTQPLTGRRVHSLVGAGSETGVRKVLHRLADTGLVVAVDVGASTVYTLNRDHIAAAAVQELASLRELLFERLRVSIGSWAVAAVHASVFGSAARGDGALSSDIDILLISADETDPEDPVWADQVSELADGVYRWTGNHAQVYGLTATQLQDHFAAAEPIVEEWTRDAVKVHGPDFRQLRHQFVSRSLG